MAFQARLHHGTPRMVDYTPSSAVAAGDVVVIGSVPHIAHLDIPANRKGALAAQGGVYQVTAAATIAVGKKVYWDDTANRVTETTGTNTSFGWTESAAGTSGSSVYVLHMPQP